MYITVWDCGCFTLALAASQCRADTMYITVWYCGCFTLALAASQCRADRMCIAVSTFVCFTLALAYLSDSAGMVQWGSSIIGIAKQDPLDQLTRFGLWPADTSEHDVMVV